MRIGKGAIKSMSDQITSLFFMSDLCGPRQRGARLTPAEKPDKRSWIRTRPQLVRGPHFKLYFLSEGSTVVVGLGQSGKNLRVT